MLFYFQIPYMVVHQPQQSSWMIGEHEHMVPGKELNRNTEQKYLKDLLTVWAWEAFRFPLLVFS